MLEDLIESGIQSEEDLRLFSFCLLGFDLPNRKVCPEHDTPMDFIIHDYFGPGGFTLVEACRDGYKTFSLAVANAAQLFGKQASVLHFGAVTEQAKNGDRYFKHLIDTNSLEKYLAKDPTTVETVFKNGARMRIDPCTVKKANSPRFPNVRVDEGDLADPEALKASKAVCSTDALGNPSSWTIVSTRQYAKGNLAREEDNIRQGGGKVFRWCYKEITENCPDSRSGTMPVNVYVNLEDLVWKSEAEYQRDAAIEAASKSEKSKTGAQEKLFQKITVFDGCLNCKLLATCRGDLKRAHGLRPIDDLITLYPNWDKDDWISQKECRSIPSTGRIYRSFTKTRNVPVDGFPVWREPRTQELIGTMRWGKDFGLEHPDVTLVGQITDGRCGHEHLWIHDECYLVHKDDEEIIKHLEALGWYKLVLPLGAGRNGTDAQKVIKEYDPKDNVLYGRPETICADPADPKGGRVYRRFGFSVTRRRLSSVMEGIKVVRRLISPADCDITHLHIHPRCVRLISDMERYSFKIDKAGDVTENPDKGGESHPDHGPDALRMLASMSFAANSAWTKYLNVYEFPATKK